jgi:hypothetical protein
VALDCSPGRSSVAMHVGRFVAFEAGGAVDAAILGDAALLAVGIPVGNAVGRAVRGRLHEQTQGRLEIGTLLLLVVGSVLGLVR